MELNGDRMFCHACGGVWLRRPEGDLSCQRCGSEFTEIIEIPPDTEPEPPRRATPLSPPRRARTHSPLNPWGDHNPWAHGDEYENEENQGFGAGPGFSHRAFRSPDGRFTFTSTTYNGGGFGGPPRTGGMEEFGDPWMPMVRHFDSIFRGLADTRQQGRRESRQADPVRQPPWQQQQQQQQSPFDYPDPEERAPDELHEFGPTGRLFPRNADGPQPPGAPLGTLGDILEMFRQDFGQGGGGPGGPEGDGFRVMTGPNPLAILSTLLTHGRHGDAVYSQDELERVITQLFEQNASGNAPPPASQNAIQSLPKKKVDQEMLGSEGKAECSICMDSVELGTEVTVLPCKHWFHYGCIEVWLNQHNTCPHCRRSIDAQEGTRENPVNVDSPESASRHSSNGFPGQSGQSPWSWSYSSGDGGGREQRRTSRGEGQAGGGLAGWMRSRFGGS